MCLTEDFFLYSSNEAKKYKEENYSKYISFTFSDIPVENKDRNK